MKTLETLWKTTIERCFTCVLPESSAALGFGFRCGFLGYTWKLSRTFRTEVQYDRNYSLTFPILLTPKKILKLH
jgi:translation elongation factor EF-4